MNRRTTASDLILAEREACAALAEKFAAEFFPGSVPWSHAMTIAKQIRERSQMHVGYFDPAPATVDEPVHKPGTPWTVDEAKRALDGVRLAPGCPNCGGTGSIPLPNIDSCEFETCARCGGIG